MSVRIPQDSERSGLVRIEGDPKGVQLARRELIEMVQRMVRMVDWSVVHKTNKAFYHLLYVDTFPRTFRKTSAPKTWSWSRSFIEQSSDRREKRSKKSGTSSLRWIFSLTFIALYLTLSLLWNNEFWLLSCNLISMIWLTSRSLSTSLTRPRRVTLSSWEGRRTRWRNVPSSFRKSLLTWYDPRLSVFVSLSVSLLLTSQQLSLIF